MLILMRPHATESPSRVGSLEVSNVSCCSTRKEPAYIYNTAIEWSFFGLYLQLWRLILSSLLQHLQHTGVLVKISFPSFTFIPLFKRTGNSQESVQFQWQRNWQEKNQSNSAPPAAGAASVSSCNPRFSRLLSKHVQDDSINTACRWWRWQKCKFLFRMACVLMSIGTCTRNGSISTAVPTDLHLLR